MSDLEPEDVPEAIDLFSRDPLYDHIGNVVEPIYPIGSKIVRMSPSADDDQNRTRYRIDPPYALPPEVRRSFRVDDEITSLFVPTTGMNVLHRLRTAIIPLVEQRFEKTIEYGRHAQFALAAQNELYGRVDKMMLKADPIDFITCRHFDQLGVLLHVERAFKCEMDAIKARIDAEIAEACVGLSLWLGCPMPLKITFDFEKTQDAQANEQEPPKVMGVNVLIAELPKTQDQQELNDTPITDDVRLLHTDHWLHLFPEDGTRRFQNEALRKAIGPSFRPDKSKTTRGGLTLN